jgi:hypothetical protein
LQLIDLHCVFFFGIAVESLRGQPWFVGGMEREEAEEYLKSSKHAFLGTFYVTTIRGGQSQNCTKKKKKKTKQKKKRKEKTPPDRFVCFRFVSFLFSIFSLQCVNLKTVFVYRLAFRPAL